MDTTVPISRKGCSGRKAPPGGISTQVCPAEGSPCGRLLLVGSPHKAALQKAPPAEGSPWHNGLVGIIGSCRFDLWMKVALQPQHIEAETGKGDMCALFLPPSHLNGHTPPSLSEPIRTPKGPIGLRAVFPQVHSRAWRNKL